MARMFRRLGAEVLDADRLAHDVIKPNAPGSRAVVRAFGRGILGPDGRIDRRRLAAVVFADARRRTQLERIIHPRVMREIRGRIRRLQRSHRTVAIVLDIPLLLEVGAERLVDVLIVVTVPPQIQRRRLHQRYGWSTEEINARRAAQWKLSAKVALADYVVDNSDGVAATQTQVKRIWKQLARVNSTPRSRSSTSQRSRR